MNDAILIDAGMDDCRVSIMQRSRDERPRFAHNFEIGNAGFDGIAGVLEHYHSLVGFKNLPAMIAVAFSGPVRGRRDTFSNGVWTFSETDLKKQFGFADVLVMNDTSALASALPWLGVKDLTPICTRSVSEVHRIGEGRYGMIYTNHGLGVGALTYTRNGYEAIDTEGGHAAFAPVTPLHTEIQRCLQKTFGRVSYERVISTPGLVNLHRAVCEVNKWPQSAMTPLEVLLYGRTNADPACRETLNVFFDILGAFAGDVALNLCTEGGVYLTSDVILETGEDIQKSAFRTRFEEKGHFSGFVSEVPTFSVANRSARLVGLARVVCERLKARESERMTATAISNAFSEAMDTIDQTVILLDKDLTVVSVSGAPWAGRSLMDEVMAPGADFAEAIAKLDSVGLLGLAPDSDGAAGLVQKLRRGEYFTVARQLFGGRISEMRAKPREAGGYVIVDRDITELHRRTDDLVNLARDLRATSSLAEAASQAKSQFLANMSHEIRTPLNGVLGMAEILGSTPLSSDQKDMLDTVILSGNLLLTVINDVLDFSKIEAGKLRLANKPFNLRSAIEDAVAALAPQAEAKDLELAIRLDPKLHENVLGDEARVRQILNNVVGNAIKFTEQGHVLVDVAARPEGGHVGVTIAVCDTGCGIPADKLERVFEMFEQVDGSASRHHDGTGLGLAITRRLLDLMEGKIGVKSEVGEGTEFRMDFVLAANLDELPAPVPQDVDLTGLGILIVDDKPVNRQILEEQARSWGMVPVSVDGAAAALKLLEAASANHFAVAIVDYQMPGMNGLELAQAIKTRTEWVDLPLLLLTSVGHLGDLDHTISDIFAGVLVKPARTAQLAKKVRTVIVQHQRCHTERVVEQTVPAAAPAEPDASEQSQRSEAVTGTFPTPQVAPVSERDTVVPFRPTADASKPAQSDGGMITVLVAEDNAVNRKVIEAMLGNGGYALHFAHDGDEAVKAYGALLPDIVLMDVSMPKLDGYGATAEIRKLEGNLGRRAAVIGLTAHAMPEDRQNCLDAGMDEYIPKPVKRETLTEVMGKYAKAS